MVIFLISHFKQDSGEVEFKFPKQTVQIVLIVRTTYFSYSNITSKSNEGNIG